MAVGKTNAGGGGTGGTLVVTAPVDVTVTATNETLGKTYTRVANWEGKATFKGLASGTWGISIDDANHEPSTPVQVVVKADYEVTVSFFSANINVTYPAGSTCTATDGVTTFTAPDATGTWAITVPNAGTWTITAEDGDKSKSADVVITEEGQSESVTLAYELVLFDYGSIVEWTKYIRNSGNDSCTIGSTIICTRNSGTSLSYTGAVAYTVNPVPLAGYSKLNVRFKSVKGLSSFIGICDSSASNKDQPNTWAASLECKVASYGSGGTAELDISEYSNQSLSIVFGEQYVKNETGSSCEVDKVWLS